MAPPKKSTSRKWYERTLAPSAQLNDNDNDNCNDNCNCNINYNYRT